MACLRSYNCIFSTEVVRYLTISAEKRAALGLLNIAFVTNTLEAY